MNADSPIRGPSTCSAPSLAQASSAVTYKGHNVGEYLADILVEDVLVLELKCVGRHAKEHTAQGLNYLRAPGRTVAG
jgi:GxxExxY protein